MGILIFIINCFSVGDSTASQTACSKHKDQKGKAREYHQIGNLDSSFGTFLSVFFLNVLQSYCIDNQELNQSNQVTVARRSPSHAPKMPSCYEDTSTKQVDSSEANLRFAMGFANIYHMKMKLEA